MPAVQIAFDFGSGQAPKARSQARLGSLLRGANAVLGAIAAPFTSAPVPETPGPCTDAGTDTETGTQAAAHDLAGEPTEARAKLDLESALRAALDMPVRLTITDNRRTMISLRKRPGFTEIRLHHMFLTADADTIGALTKYIGRADRSAGALLGRYIEQHREGIRRRATRTPQLSTSGAHHDLLQIFADVSASYFEGRDDVRITWGRDPQARNAAPLGRKPRSRKMRRSIKLGSYCSRDRLIRVHPALDAEFVPRFFLEYIVYHELLHHVLPPKVRAGRRQLHDRAFKLKEREFPQYSEALRWERDNLDRLLRR